jgi:hypothetical protein
VDQASLAAALRKYVHELGRMTAELHLAGALRQPSDQLSGANKKEE